MSTPKKPGLLTRLKSSSPGVLLLRWLVAAAIVFATYNPSGTSIVHWITEHPEPTNAWVILLGIVTLLLNVSLLIAAWKSLGKVGTIIALILFASLIYLSLQEGWVSTDNMKSIQWLLLLLYSLFLGVGLAGAIIWRRATGQVVTDEADDIGH